VKTLLHGWNRFWFAEQPATPIALFRILFGVLLLQVLLVELLPNFAYFYGVRAIIDTSSTVTYWWNAQPRFDLFLLGPETDAFRLSLFFVLVVAAFTLTIGLFTRVSAIFVYLGLLTLHQQCPLNRDGGDAFMQIVALLLCFSHCKDAYSIDCLLEKKRNQSANCGQNALFKPWAQRLLQVQLAIIYGHSFINKAIGPAWQNGTAFYVSTHMADFIRFPLPHFMEDLLISQILTYYTLVVELFMFTLVWFKPFRYWVLLSGVILHCGIEYMMNLPGFETLMVASYVNFIEPADLNRVIDWLKRKLFTLLSLFRYE